MEQDTDRQSVQFGRRKPMTRATLNVRMPFAVTISTARRHNSITAQTDGAGWSTRKLEVQLDVVCSSVLWGIGWGCITVSES